MQRLLLAALLLCSAAAYAESWTNVSLLDSSCAAKVKNNPDAHTRACAMQCAGAGYGIQTADGRYLKFDKRGNDEALQLLKASNKPDHLRVNVQGKQQGDTIAVQSVSF